MPLALHLFIADVRRFRALIAGWLLLVGALTAFDGTRAMFEHDFEVTAAAGMARGMLWTATQLVLLVLVARVIQADPPTGSDAFWMTRPIEPRSLLASKLTLLTILVVAAPVLAEAALMAACRMPAPAILRASLQSILVQTLLLVVLASIASLTATVAQFLVLGIASMIAHSGLFFTAAVMYERTQRTSFSFSLVSGEIAGAPKLPVPAGDPTVGRFALAILAGLALIATQYLTRSRARSVPAGAAGLSLAYAVAAVWPWPLLRPIEEVPIFATNPSSLQLHAADSIVLNVGGSDSNGRVTALIGRGQLRVSDIDPGWVPSVALASGSVTLENGQPLSSLASSPSEPVPIDTEYRPPLSEVPRLLLDVRTLMLDSSYRQTATLLIVPDSGLTEATPINGTYDGRFRVTLAFCEIVATIPARAGIVFQDGSYRLTLNETTSGANDAVVVDGRESSAHSLFDRRSAPTYWFYLRNARAGEALSGRGERFGARVGSIGLPTPFLLPLWYTLSRIPPAFDTHGIRVRFPTSYFAQKQPGQDRSNRSLSAEWIAGAELVIVRVTLGATVERTLHIPRVPIGNGALMLLHLLASDVRRFRLAMVAWLCLEVVDTALRVVLPSLEAHQATNTAAGLLPVTAHILAVVLVVLVAQAHPLVGTDAFWMTRPIPRFTLLASKLTLLSMLMIGVPVVCELARMAIDHVPARQMLLVAAQTAVFDALWLALVMAGAVVTGSLAGFATLTGVAIAAMALSIAFSLAYSAIRPSDAPPTSVGPAPPADYSGFVIFVVLMTIAALVPVLVQYRTRSRALAGAAGVVAVVSAFTIPSFLPWTFLKPRLLVPEWAQRESALRLTVDAKTLDFGNRISRSSTRRVWRTGWARLWLNGIEPGWSAAVGLLDATIRLDTGETLQNADGAYAAAVPFEGSIEHPQQTILRRALDVQHLPAFNLQEGERPMVFVTSGSRFAEARFSQGNLLRAIPREPHARGSGRRSAAPRGGLLPGWRLSLSHRRCSLCRGWHLKDSRPTIGRDFLVRSPANISVQLLLAQRANE